MFKKIALIIISATFILLGVLIFFTDTKKGVPVKTGHQPTPTPFRPDSFSPYNFNPAEKREFDAERNYAVENKKNLDEKPWLANLPLKSDNYFVIYNQATDKFIATLFLFRFGVITKEQQVEIAKNEVVEALIKIGVDTKREKVEYVETNR